MIERPGKLFPTKSTVESPRPLPAIPREGAELIRQNARGVACVVAFLGQGDDASDGHKSHGGLGNLSSHRARLFSTQSMAGL